MKRKKTSSSLMLMMVITSLFLVIFLSVVWGKIRTQNLQPTLNQQEMTIDSATVIKQKDSIILSLEKDNKRLKEMYDRKHDTIFIPKPVLIKPKSDSIK